MYIKSLEYCDSASEWQLESLKLDNPLTLLVGASGVGKTQILRALLNLKEIATGTTLNGIKWAIEFNTDNEHCYRWKGEFENLGFTQDLFKFEDDDKNSQSPRIIYEKLTLNSEEILSRNKTGIFFEGKQTVQLPHHQSVLQLLKEEEKVSHANKGFDRIHFSSDSFRQRMARLKSISKEYGSLESIRESQQPIDFKLYLTYLNARETFEKIKTNFLSIFPYVEDLKVAPFEEEELQDAYPFVKEIPVVQFKEKGVAHWIHEGKMSRGMFRSLKHLAEIYLCADNSVILIDEFENSLGVNCIDAMTDHLMNQDRTLQFIVTSHHPYIINHIPFKYWKLVTRRAGKVITHDASEFSLGKSKHEAFIQLINLDEYSEGIAT